MEILTTSRLTIRQLKSCDVVGLMKIFSDPVATKYASGTKSITQVNMLLAAIIEEYQQHGHSLWAVIETASGSFVGICGLIQQHIRGCWETELGYHFIPRYWGNGYATEAGNFCLDYAFNQLQKNTIVSFINPDNAPSIAVAQRLGMNRDVLLKANENTWDKEIVVYSVIRQPIET